MHHPSSPATGDLAAPSVPMGVPLLLRDLIHERTGLFFEVDRFDMMLDKLRERLAAHDCHSFLDYYYLLKYEEKGPAEWRRVMDAFSVQETYFWREFAQIGAIVRTIVPQWFKTRQAPMRIWSSACATGEEPLTVVMALQEAGLDHLPIEILASDASDAALEKAQRGIYRERSFRALSPELREKYFTRVENGWQISPAVQRRVTFQHANITVPAEIAPLANSPVVLCRNVFIYFSPDAIRRTLASFAERMPAESYLFVGSSESLLRLTADFELREMDDAFVYARTPRTPFTLR